MRTILRLICLLLALSLVFCFAGCKDKAQEQNNEEKFVIPKNLMTVEEYHNEIKKLQDTKNFTDELKRIVY